ncbi:MAG: hypothetical protein WBA74_20935 [Cyclobacteriaceae bacterium]
MKEFPFQSSLSLQGLVDYWKKEKSQEGEFGYFVVRQIEEYLEKHPELLSDITNYNILEENCDFIDFLMSAVIPSANVHTMAAAYRPFSFESFYETNQHKELIDLHGSILELAKDIPMESLNLHKTFGAYAEILKRFYDVDISIEKPIILGAIHPVKKLNNYYKVEYNGTFCLIRLKGDLPELSQATIKELVANPFDIDLWSTHLPFDLFEFHGFTVYNLIDVTAEQTISSIKESLLNKDAIVDPNSFLLLEEKFQSLLGSKDLKIGISGFNKNKSCFVDYRENFKNDLKMDIANLPCMESQKKIYQHFSQHQEPMIIQDVDHSDLLPEMKQFFKAKNINSVIISPLFYEQKFIGVLEIGSEKVGSLNSLVTAKIETVLPLLSIALKRSSEELENKVQSVIKEKYTSIHPSVEWKFLNAAYNIIEQRDNGMEAIPEDIVFKDVYPLYGASDVRASSVKRNEAITQDLKKQLKIGRDTLKSLNKLKKFPFLEQLEFQVSKLHSKISKGILSGDETNIISFLQQELEPVFRKLDKESVKFRELTAAYWDVLDKELGTVYDARKDFESSLTMVNNVISTFIEERQVEAQNVFPHFFEKYKSDGVEYNMYIGQSLTNEKEYHPIYGRNLKIWQLITMAEAAQKAFELKSQLPLPLDMTHLILLHNSTLSVEFRMDEKVFDVDGAYNMRYEIVKKRIDKALVDGTDERITQPGKLTIVYSSEKDANEYMGYIEFLQSKGYFTDEVEQLDIEPLQGVVGLKALRLTVDRNKDKVIDELEMMEFITLPEKD